MLERRLYLFLFWVVKWDCLERTMFRLKFSQARMEGTEVKSTQVLKYVHKCPKEEWGLAGL